MKTINKLLSLCLALLLCCMTPALLAHAEDLEPPADDPLDPDPFVKISLITCDIEISSSGLSSDYCHVYVPDTTCTVDVSMELQRASSYGGSWETIKTWSDSGTRTVTLDEYWYVGHGYYYRVYISVAVWDSDGLLADATGVESSYVYY